MIHVSFFLIFFCYMLRLRYLYPLSVTITSLGNGGAVFLLGRENGEWSMGYNGCIVGVDTWASGALFLYSKLCFFDCVSDVFSVFCFAYLLEQIWSLSFDLISRCLEVSVYYL